jgi:dephospho-CoA kinase
MVIGVTGNLGVGKTTVARMFRKLGAKVIDADRIAHMIIKPCTPAYRQVIASFGRGVLAGIHISREKLAGIVFSEEKKIKKLNKITHPKILKIIKNKIKELPDKRILVIDAPLLIESGLSSWVDRLVVVKSQPGIQKQRLKKCGFTTNEINRRLNVQLSQKTKIGLADFVIDNSGTRNETQKQVRDIWRRIIINTGGRKWKRQRRWRN